MVTETGDWRVIANAIKTLAIRGAPLIGVAAALAVAMEAARLNDRNGSRERIEQTIAGLRATRPTAVNLFNALDRMATRLGFEPDAGLSRALEQEAVTILAEDRARCDRIAAAGLALIPQNARILTICNTGYLATAGIGTALGVIYRAHDAGLIREVFVPETRPLLQGARLTMWELSLAGIPARLLVDGAIPAKLRGGMDLAIIGADRIASNGDTANKTGSMGLALACRRFGVPLYVAAPMTTFDLQCQNGSKIPIEERPGDEVTLINGRRLAPVGVPVFNPAFDVVEADLISGFITDEGLKSPPFHFSDADGDAHAT